MRTAALRFLTRREHAVTELNRKLVQRGFAPNHVRQVLGQLEEEGLLSDLRYAEARIRSRIGQGYGKLRISRELLETGVSEHLIAQAWDEQQTDWRQQMETVRCKRFGQDLPVEYKERARQSRFLQYRGFPPELIRELFGN